MRASGKPLKKPKSMPPSAKAIITNIEAPEDFEEPIEIRPSRNKFFNEVIQDLIDLHDRKNHDYASASNPFSNFDIGARYVQMKGYELFDSVAQVEAMKGTKLARLLNFVLSEKDPNFESVEDTEKDFVVYWIISEAMKIRDINRGAGNFADALEQRQK